MPNPGLSEDDMAAVLEAIEQTGGNQVQAAKLLNLDRSTFRNRLATAMRRQVGIVKPEHLSPYVVKGTSTLVDAEGNTKLQWIKTSLDRERFDDAMREYVEWLAQGAKGKAELTPAPVHSQDDLLSVYAIGDPHLGLFSWAAETGEDFDLKIAERLTTSAVSRLVSCSPDSSEALILELGDLLHADDSTNQTPTSKHSLDVDTRYAKVMQVALRTLKHCISLALQKHQKVTVWLIGGNHDPHSSFAIAMCLNAFYENEPRVIIDLSPAAFRYMQFGKVLIGSHHGHGIRFDALPGIMATDKASEWGNSLYRYWYVGHIHHLQRRELPGAVVESFRTLAARDAWHSAKGYRAGRDMQLIVHHRDFGEIERHRADVAMLQGAA
jgi:hypothetical protein